MKAQITFTYTYEFEFAYDPRSVNGEVQQAYDHFHNTGGRNAHDLVKEDDSMEFIQYDHDDIRELYDANPNMTLEQLSNITHHSIYELKHILTCEG